MSVLSKIKKFSSKEYRDAYLRTQIGAGIAYQVQGLRAKLCLTQSEFAERTGKTQTVISRLENSMSGSVTVKTLLDVAAGADVALLVQFVSYPEFLERTEDMTEVALRPDTIHETLDQLEVSAPSLGSGWYAYEPSYRSANVINMMQGVGLVSFVSMIGTSTVNSIPQGGAQISPSPDPTQKSEKYKIPRVESSPVVDLTSLINTVSMGEMH